MGLSMAAVAFFTVTPKSHSVATTPKPFKPSQFTPLQSLILPQISRRGRTRLPLIRASRSISNADAAAASSVRIGGGGVESDRLPLQSPILPQISRCGRTRLPLIRASGSISNADAAATSSIRDGGVESDRLPSDVRKRTMDAIDSCERRVTIGDAASKTGLKLNESQKALQALAADTNGFLEVSDEGDVLYIFPKDYRLKLAAKSVKIKLEPCSKRGRYLHLFVHWFKFCRNFLL